MCNRCGYHLRAPQEASPKGLKTERTVKHSARLGGRGTFTVDSPVAFKGDRGAQGIGTTTPKGVRQGGQTSGLRTSNGLSGRVELLCLLASLQFPTVRADGERASSQLPSRCAPLGAARDAAKATVARHSGSAGMRSISREIVPCPTYYETVGMPRQHKGHTVGRHL